MLEYITAGESHGQAIITVISGFPAGVRIKEEVINSELKRRRACAGRGPRMSLEKDKIEILSGLKNGKTLGAPITIQVRNQKNTLDFLPPITRVRPGHIDLAAAMKFLVPDGRIGAEQASARTTVGRVIAGSVAKSLLDYFAIKVFGYTTQIGSVQADHPTGRPVNWRTGRQTSFYTLDKNVIPEWKHLLSEAENDGDTLGGCFEVAGFNIPVGLGDHTHWQDRFDARLSQAIMAIPAVKAVEIGLGFGYADKPGSQVMDLFATHNNRPILNKYGGWKRMTNYAGGIEGGLTSGENIIVRAAVKPIPTLKRPLPTIDLRTKRPAKAQVESSDICAVPAASVIGEAVVAFEIARAFISRFPGRTIAEITTDFRTYQTHLKKKFG
ncbi:MAG: chorismate synthase [Planctomycetota bacterium]